MVVPDHAVGQVEDRGGRAVVLLELDDPHIRPTPLEGIDVADFGATKTVDGLVVVTDDADKGMGTDQLLQEGELAGVGVLVLVDQDHLVAAMGPVRHLRIGKQLGRFQDQVGEIDVSGTVQGLLVALVELGKLGITTPTDHGRGNALVLQQPDLPALLPQDFRILVGEGLFQQLEAIAVVVDGKTRGKAGLVGKTAEHESPETVEGPDGGMGVRFRIPDHLQHTLLHLPGRLVGECHRKDLERGNAELPDRIGDLGGDHPCLSGTRARKHEQRMVEFQYRFLLGAVQPCEHFPDISHESSNATASKSMSLTERIPACTTDPGFRSLPMTTVNPSTSGAWP